MPPVLSVIIPTYNRRDTLRRTLEGWAHHECRVPIEILVVDDGSEDGTAECLADAARRDSRLRVWVQPHSGPAQARNRAIAQASSPCLLFGGDDIRPGPGLVDGHARAHEAPGAPIMVLGRTDWDPERPITSIMRHVTGFGGQQFRYGYLSDRQRLGFKYFYGSNVSIKRSALTPLPGPFDAAFAGAALEDADLGYRLMGPRKEIEYQSALLAWHDHNYDLAGFAQRQYRVGRATGGLVAKHREIASEFGWDLVSKAISDAAMVTAVEGQAVSLEEVTDLERDILSSFASVEPKDHRQLDRNCLGIFWYFQAKGMAEARVAAPDLASVLAVLMETAMLFSIRGALRDPSFGLPGEVRATLGQIADRLALVHRNGRLARSLRWKLSIRAREMSYALQVRGF